jgi:hypothetical protein
LHQQRFAGRVKAFEGAAPRLFRPMYAQANMGHPSREAGLVVPQALIRGGVLLPDQSASQHAPE